MPSRRRRWIRGLAVLLIAGVPVFTLATVATSTAVLAQAAGGNPCAAANPCEAANPCAPVPSGTVTDAEASAAYLKIEDDLQAGYAKSGLLAAKDYLSWDRYNSAPYLSQTHGNRLVDNYANRGAKDYGKFEKAGVMPGGSVLAKDSFRVTPGGKVEPGPLFIMEKMKAGFSPETGDWRFTMIMPDGTIYGATKGENADKVEFCAGCHAAASTDYMFFVPPEYRLAR